MRQNIETSKILIDSLNKLREVSIGIKTHIDSESETLLSTDSSNTVFEYLDKTAEDIGEMIKRDILYAHYFVDVIAK